MPSTAPDATAVAVGIIENAQHQVLVAQRPEHKHQGGKWEFPGGKIHAGEAVPEALARELHEGLGITLRAACPWQRVRHFTPERACCLMPAPRWSRRVAQTACISTAAGLMALPGRPLPRSCLVAASCHDIAELVQAARVGVDFAVLSPVLPTVSHPHATALGWQGFLRLRVHSDAPVYALGGMLPEHLRVVRAMGAQGLP